MKYKVKVLLLLLCILNSIPVELQALSNNNILIQNSSMWTDRLHHLLGEEYEWLICYRCQGSGRVLCTLCTGQGMLVQYIEQLDIDKR